MLRKIVKYRAEALATLLLASCIFVAATMAADEPGPGTDVETRIAPAKPSELPAWQQEIRELRSRDAELLAELNAAYVAAADHGEALRIQRRIHENKLGTRIGVLKIQADHARRSGDEVRGDEIEAVIKTLTAQPERRQPVDRESVIRADQ